MNAPTLPRYMVPGGHGIEKHDAGLLYRREDVDRMIPAMLAEARRDALREVLKAAEIHHDKNWSPSLECIVLDLIDAPAPARDEICRICDGGPGNEGVCLCGEKAYEAPAPAQPSVQEAARLLADYLTTTYGNLSYEEASRLPEKQGQEWLAYLYAIGYIETVASEDQT